MNIRKSILPVALAGLMISGSALAAATDGPSPIVPNPGTSAGTQGAGGEVKFTGEITDVSCDVSTASKSQTVDLGKWAKSYFESRTETTETPFTISVKDCPSSVKTVAVLFDGDKDSGDPTLLKVADGGATGVGIKLYEADRSTPISIGSISKAVKVVEAADGGSADLNFFADYKSDGAAITVGKANSVSNFVMVYN
ncbi:fimbrial protein [Pantoea sp. Bo_2]|uniref:fimbrial protein n=1 Tax=unclassified Pantoea TaxID=2630326 RepID=UPI0012324AC5|nr:MULTISPECIES: fimbrial protein [unclassified Pantoea]KAA5938875.1 fimbrial protein [Pantoea sp. VH_3]KAA5948089.1 fimbrial protein [Pantoea sp. VH_25]KAA5957144.1 fimbrial protein [Pantoea sp. VH_16]KAA5958019.1 fimbrial protein [Pantoea sp. VH_24]KAA5962431.1 fimbrial protein [Pantoea sp. VH_18]